MTGVWTSVTALAFAAMAGGAAAQEGTVAASDAVVAPAFELVMPGDGQMLTSKLGDVPVFDRDGVQVGDVEDTVIDEDGAVVAILIGVGGTLGIGERPVAVRFEHVDVEAKEGQRRLILDLTKAELDRALAFAPPSQ